MGRGVSTCATCDGFFFKDQNIMVVGRRRLRAGGGALPVAARAARCEVVHRRDSLRASKIMQERAFKNPKIAFIWDTAVEEVLDAAQGKVTGGAPQEPQDRGAVGGPGRRALRRDRARAQHRRSFAGQVDLHPNGYIKVAPGTTQTSVPGVFAAGDVQDFTYRQAVTAAGTGCMAALEAERYLEAHHAEH